MHMDVRRQPLVLSVLSRTFLRAVWSSPPRDKEKERAAQDSRVQAAGVCPGGKAGTGAGGRDCGWRPPGLGAAGGGATAAAGDGSVAGAAQAARCRALALSLTTTRWYLTTTSVHRP